MPPAIPGLTYVPDYLSFEDEARVLARIDAQPWRSDLARRVQHYGYRYDYKARTVHQDQYLGPLPPWLHELATGLCADGLVSTVPEQAIINEYEPGQGISTHIDCIPCFGPEIATISLGSPCIMRFHHQPSGVTIDHRLDQRSLLLLATDARYAWTHAIPARKTDTINGTTTMRARRISITFRTIKTP